MTLHTLTPYLAVRDARAALDFYVAVFAATRVSEPIVMDDGRIGHAELQIGDSLLMFAEESPEIGHVPGGSVRIEVPDAALVVDQATGHGAEVIRPVTDSPYGRGGAIRDPFGQRWIVTEAAPR